MSRIGKKGIDIPEKVEIKVSANSVSVKGPLGELVRTFDKRIKIEVKDGRVEINPTVLSIETNALWGTTASHIDNMIQGVTKGYEKKLIIEGIGYKCEMSGQNLTLRVGFSHPVKISIPSGLKVTSDKGLITIGGTDKELVTSFAAKLKSIKKPEPYKGKGLRYDGEVIRRKEGKKTV